jgi:uncharacterized membrane protein
MQSTKEEAIIVKILEEGKNTTENGTSEFQKIELKLKNNDELIQIENFQEPFSNWNPYKINQRVVVQADEVGNWIVTDFVRRPALLQLSLIFTFLVVLIGKMWGVRSLLSLAASFAVIFGMILPLILKGFNPLTVTLVGAVLIVPMTFYISHGWKVKTHVAILGTLIALTISGMLAGTFMNATYLTGFASEEAGFLSVMTHNELDIRGLLLAGIIISLLGTLDDVAVSQASFVQQLKEADPRMSFRELFIRAMRVGQDHISSMVNTLVLVYAGASLPLLLLFLTSNASPMEVINLEIVAEEIVRTLTGSIGVVMAAPITTLIAATVFTNKKNIEKEPIPRKKRKKKLIFNH